MMTGLGGIEDYPDIARTAQACGWTSLAVPDSLFYPEVTASEYPYLSTEAVREALDGVPVLDPVVAMAMLVGVTQTLRFYPAVLKVLCASPGAGQGPVVAGGYQRQPHSPGGRA
ncbi:MAG: hypothetical protein MZV70_61605 [Desulfobacterales bacterium]|nr:hypothetical protein [Desulfobacterales bacterium]